MHKETEGPKGDKSDWEPPAKKQRESTKTPATATTPWFADLPKRETKYRLAKNLDAVTRKAKQVYESSEMYMEQRVRRRRSVRSFLTYRKIPKFSYTRKLCFNLRKIQTKRPKLRLFYQNDANRKARCEDPDQTAPLGAV